jgi:lysophospholipase L1-like esterase
MTKSPFLFDSYALLLLLQKEKGFEKVDDAGASVVSRSTPLSAGRVGGRIQLKKKVFIIGLAIVFTWGWSLNLWAQPVRIALTAVKEEAKVSSQTPIVVIGASYVKAWKVPEIGGLKVINKGVDGNQSFEMLARFQNDVLVSNPKAVLLWGFINDIHRSKRDEIQPALARAKESFKEMVRLARANGSEPILATEVTIRGKDDFRSRVAGWVGAILGKTSYQEYVNGHVLEMNRWLKEFGRDQKIVVLDFQPVISEASGFRKKEYATEDGTHISLAGYEKLTAYVRATLGKDAPWKKS